MSTSIKHAGRCLSNLCSGIPLWVLAPAVFTAAIGLRSPSLFTHPRFWAEEGPLYFAEMQRLTPLRSLAFTANGNFQLATNLFVEAALAVRTRYAALPTTLLAWLVACYCCVLIARFMAARACSRLAIVVAIALFALQTSGYEVFLNATNVQWVGSAVTLFLFLSDDVPPRWPAAAIRHAIVAALGLTGVTSCILLPIVALATWRRGGRDRWTMLLVLSAATLVQLAIVATHAEGSVRSFSLSPGHLVPVAMQGVLGGFLPPGLLDAIGGLLWRHDRFASAIALQIGLVGFATLALIAATAVERLGRSVVALLVAAVLFATLVNEYGALGSIDDMTSGSGASRYFFLASTCVVVMTASGLDARSAWRRGTSITLVTIAVVNALLVAFASSFPAIYFTGVPFGAQVKACAPGIPCEVYAWPETDYDHFTIDADRLRNP